MRLLALDTETTGLNAETDQIIELGYVIKDYGDPKPLAAVTEMVRLSEGQDISPEITAITGIKHDHLKRADYPGRVLARLEAAIREYDVQAIVAHNASFDKKFVDKAMERAGDQHPAYGSTPWLCTKDDILYPRHFRATNLIYVAASLGFLNPFPHAAVFDAYTSLKVLELAGEKLGETLDKILERAKSPWVVVRALVPPPYNDVRPDGEKGVDLAKARGFKWQDCGDTRTYSKCWVKRLRACNLEAELTEAPFKIAVLSTTAEKKKDGQESSQESPEERDLLRPG